MTTYTEKRKKKPFDWNVFLDMAIDLDISSTTHKLNHIASSWVTCAVGTQCDILSRGKDGTPVDDKLHDLGSDFYTDIKSSDWKAARRTLRKIERRSGFLIQQTNREELKRAAKFTRDLHAGWRQKAKA